MSNLQAIKPMAPWIGCGTSGAWKDWRQALAEAGLNYQVETQELMTTGSRAIADDVVANVCQNAKGIWNEGDILGCVSRQYKIVQNEEAFSIFDAYPDATIIAAGETVQGLVFMVAEVQSFKLSGEAYTMYILATNSFNRAFPTGYFFTNIRIICQNMYANLSKVANQIAIQHRSNASEHIEAAQNAHHMQVMFLNQFKEYAKALQDAYIEPKKVSKALTELTKIIYPVPMQTGNRPSFFEAMCDTADRKREDWIAQYFEAKHNAKHVDSVFGLFNAYFDFVSHGLARAPRAGVVIQDKIFSDIVSGDSVNKKALALFDGLAKHSL